MRLSGRFTVIRTISSRIPEKAVNQSTRYFVRWWQLSVQANYLPLRNVRNAFCFVARFVLLRIFFDGIWNPSFFDFQNAIRKNLLDLRSRDSSKGQPKIATTTTSNLLLLQGMLPSGVIHDSKGWNRIKWLGTPFCRHYQIFFHS